MKVKTLTKIGIALVVAVAFFSVSAYAIQPTDLPKGASHAAEKAAKGIQNATAKITAEHGKPTTTETMMASEKPLAKASEEKIDNPNKANKGARAIEVLTRNLEKVKSEKAKVALQKAIDNKSKIHEEEDEEEEEAEGV
ncbi:MAG TPA: hypothetical protein PLO78_04475 [Candidatus Omnitrophota bacterium]|nr:hypothetical protein [Candidatus Omnitrophota bacterium]